MSDMITTHSMVQADRSYVYGMVDQMYMYCNTAVSILLPVNIMLSSWPEGLNFPIAHSYSTLVFQIAVH